ncbi:MAG: hypothetical protein K6G31_12510 [Paludibacteraceae bacterium]|nr:hypothetical protein [Paludibacteraceae bacterium]MBR6042408.1 hypothetical protein [Paludibacteraceae bacterium]MCR5570077.1 hypothetical protein [Paludibacteraceae bacterium]
MEYYFKEDQPIVTMGNNAVKTAWIDETSLVADRKETTPVVTKPTSSFEHIFG